MVDRPARAVRDYAALDLRPGVRCRGTACCARAPGVWFGFSGHGMPCPYGRAGDRDGVGPVPYSRPEPP